MKLTVATPQNSTGQVAMLVGLMVTPTAQLHKCYNYKMAVSTSHGFMDSLLYTVMMWVFVIHIYLCQQLFMLRCLHTLQSGWHVQGVALSVFIKHTCWQFLILHLAMYFSFKMCRLFSITFHVSGFIPHSQYFQCSSVCVIVSYLTFFFPHPKVNMSSFSAAGRMQQ